MQHCTSKQKNSRKNNTDRSIIYSAGSNLNASKNIIGVLALASCCLCRFVGLSSENILAYSWYRCWALGWLLL